MVQHHRSFGASCPEAGNSTAPLARETRPSAGGSVLIRILLANLNSGSSTSANHARFQRRDCEELAASAPLDVFGKNMFASNRPPDLPRHKTWLVASGYGDAHAQCDPRR